MALYNKMQKLVDATVEEFCRRVAEKYDHLDVEEMMVLWKETAKAPKRKSDKPKKKTAYMNFSQTVRAEMKAANPEVTFGEISKEVSRRWKELSAEQKLSWTPSVDHTESSESGEEETLPHPTASPIVLEAKASLEEEATPTKKTKSKTKALSPAKTTTKNKSKALSETKTTPKKPWSPPASSPSPVKAMTPVKKTKASSPAKMKLVELKKLCKEKGLSIKGLKTREELEELLESIDESDKEDNGSESEDDYSGTLVDAVDDDAILA
jgi:hypothetical protein